MSEINFGIVDWGLIPYDQALPRMMSLVDDVAAARAAETVIFCTHPPIVTMGRATKPEHVTTWSGPTLEVARGGSVTYHGPSQLIVYPIVNLKNARKGRKSQEIAGFLRDFENAIVRTLNSYGVTAVGRSVRQKNTEAKATDETGVWVGDRKIASLGLGVRHWVTFHGAAINLDQDTRAFEGINPCGFKKDVMVSLEEILGRKIDRTEFAARLTRELQIAL